MTNEPLTIADFWTTYRRDVIPAGASPVQVRECRRAFYAGASSLLSGMLDVAVDGEEPTEQDFRRMEDLAGELARFAEGAMLGVN